MFWRSQTRQPVTPLPVEAAARRTAEHSLFMCARVNQTCGMLNRLRQAAEGESAWSKESVRYRSGQRQGRRTIKWFDIIEYLRCFEH